MTLVRRVARPLLAAIFITGGLDQLRHPGKRVEQARPVVGAVADKVEQVPNDPELLVRANGAAMLAGGGLLALGRVPRVASTVLAGSLIPTTIAGHPFWTETDPAKKKQMQTAFLSNLGLLGGLLLAAVDTEGKPGVAYRAKLLGESATRSARTARREARHAAKAAAREARLKAAQAQNALG